MATTSDYLNKLVEQRNDLAIRLVDKGVEASTDETLETLIPKVSDIESGGSGFENLLKDTTWQKGFISASGALDTAGGLGEPIVSDIIDVELSEITVISLTERPQNSGISYWIGVAEYYLTGAFKRRITQESGTSKLGAFKISSPKIRIMIRTFGNPIEVSAYRSDNFNYNPITVDYEGVQ